MPISSLAYELKSGTDLSDEWRLGQRPGLEERLGIQVSTMFSPFREAVLLSYQISQMEEFLKHESRLQMVDQQIDE